jgi:hypothetical protein
MKKVDHLLDLLHAAAALLDDDGVSRKADTLRGFANAIAPLRGRKLDELSEVLAKVTLDANRD